jgi:hypothetical protein
MKRLVQILVLSQDPLLAEAARAAFGGSRLRCNLELVSSVGDALTVLSAADQRPAVVQTSLVVVDMALGDQSVRFVEIVKQTDELRPIPVVALCPVEHVSPHEVYERHANCSLPRPTDGAALQSLMEGVRDFWLSVVKLPRRAGKR